MERSARYALAARVSKLSRARQHARRRSPCEGQKQNRFRANACLDKPRDSINERARLSCSCSGNYQEWTVNRRHSFVLRFVKLAFVINSGRALSNRRQSL